jgi:hypothetical protein
MIDLIKAHNLYGHVSFTEHDHSYINKLTGKRLISVTTLIKKLQIPFDEKRFLPLSAAKLNLTELEVLEEWKKQKEFGIEVGKLIHLYLENLFINKHIQITTQLDIVDRLNLYKNFAYNYYNDHQHLLPVFYEKIITINNIAGQLDFLGYNLKENIYTLRDYKTDKKFRTENRYQKFKYPINHLDDCEYNKYALQLSFYRYMLEPLNLEFEDNKIIWFNEQNTNYKIIELPYLKDEVNLIINDNTRNNFYI